MQPRSKTENRDVLPSQRRYQKQPPKHGIMLTDIQILCISTPKSTSQRFWCLRPFFNFAEHSFRAFVHSFIRHKGAAFNEIRTKWNWHNLRNRHYADISQKLTESL
jgi:hypothetical protein